MKKYCDGQIELTSNIESPDIKDKAAATKRIAEELFKKITYRFTQPDVSGRPGLVDAESAINILASMLAMYVVLVNRANPGNEVLDSVVDLLRMQVVAWRTRDLPDPTALHSWN